MHKSTVMPTLNALISLNFARDINYYCYSSGSAGAWGIIIIINSSCHVDSAASITCRWQGIAKVLLDVMSDFLTRINELFRLDAKSALGKQALTTLCTCVLLLY